MSLKAAPVNLTLIHVAPWPEHDLDMTPSPSSNSSVFMDGDTKTPILTTEWTTVCSPKTCVQPNHPCLWILYAEIGNSNVRIWDLALLVPNTLFLIFLIFKCKIAITKLRQSSSAVFFAFYAMVLTAAIISVTRAVVSMMVNAIEPSGKKTDTILWIIVKFFLISIELSVIIFGLCSSMVDSKAIIKRILLVTSAISLAYSVTQGCLEWKFPDSYYTSSCTFIYAHGGMLFWCITSSLFSLGYFIVLLLPCTRIKNKIQLPVKRSFYSYVTFLAVLNIVQAISSGLVFDGRNLAICVVDVTSFVYFSIFAPLIYLTFLHKFFRNHKQPLLLSYNNPDEVDDEVRRLPSSGSIQSKEDPIDFAPTVFNSTTEFGQSPTITFGPLVIDGPMTNVSVQASDHPSIDYAE